MVTTERGASGDFVELMTQFQGRLYGYLLSLSGDPDAANDILQETNVVLWRQWRQFELGSNFKAWSFRIAHFQFMAFRQKMLRDKVLFSDELLATLATEALDEDDFHSERVELLERCLNRLPPQPRKAIQLRYADELAIAEMAKQLGRNVNAVYQILFRARQFLIDCVQKERPSEIA